MTLKFDVSCAERKLVPEWFLRFRSTTFSLYLIMTSLLFAICYSRLDQLNTKENPHRIEDLKSAL